MEIAVPDIELPMIVYVDEDEDAREDFYIDAKKSGMFGDVVILSPEPLISDMLDLLLNMNFDALVSDFRLSDASPVEYSGTDLVDAFLAIRSDFPCFIRTSYDNDALHASNDVNRVYSKGTKAGEQVERSLLERISLQIERHRKHMLEWCEELDDILKIDRAKLSALQIERIVELDGKIEAHLGADVPVAVEAKKALLSGDFAEKQHELMVETERLIAEMKQALDE
tara:strand:+ start:7513 stop:8190 length:678 start_codon:yes stop_codon:yes gene_type:complete